MARPKRSSRSRHIDPIETTLPEPAPRKALPWLWHLAAALSFWLLQFKVNLNSDIWFHLAAGRLIWQDKAIPAADTWSFTAAGRPWQNHEWLADVFFYLWSKAFGVDSLVLWQWLVVGAAYLLLFRLIQRITGSYFVAWLLSMLALAVGTPFYEIRPHLWTVLAFVPLILWTWERERPSLFQAMLLPALFLVWINLHGGAIFGLMAAFITLGCRALVPGDGEEPWRRWWPIYRDGVSTLLVRSDVALPGELRPTPDSGYHWWAVGRQALDEQRLDDAASALERALEADPRLWPACQELALVRSAQGDREATVRTVDRCRAIFPDLQLDADELLKRGARARPG